MSTSTSADEAEIREIINSMFDAISWTKDRAPNFDTFGAAVHEAAIVLPAARPATPTSISAFTERMKGLHAGGAMASFEEVATGTIVKVYGNVAVAIGGFSALIDGAGSRGVNGFLFARDQGKWQIVGMAWDNEHPDSPIPEDLA